ncbi:hypothetical protein BDR03DRAFT_876534, partial [Suillus americanus]
GHLILWYLPNAISPWIQAEMEEATIGMGSLLKKSMTSGLDTQWRTFPGNFHTSDRHQLTPGCINLAPCWFQQGREVSTASSPECSCSCRHSSHMGFHQPMGSPLRCQPP